MRNRLTHRILLGIELTLACWTEEGGKGGQVKVSFADQPVCCCASFLSPSHYLSFCFLEEGK